MPFVSLEFLALVVTALGLYYLPILRRGQVGTLVLASLVFYAWDQWRLLPVLMVAVAVTYLSMVRAIHGSRSAAAFGIVANLLILCFFKYKFLFVPDLAERTSGSATVDFLLHLPLPIGISFFVFHNISLIVDYYKHGRTRPRPSPLEVVLYILFFPQLVSGPITRAISFMPQIGAKCFRDIPWGQATELLILGLFFKLFCANNLAQATALMSPEHFPTLGGGDRLFLLFLYSGQIYADFFGYSTMALGLALLFGYRLPVNFRLPYTAASFSDFWNRWHISLSQWLRHYLYFPLGGNRISPARTYVNLMAVMVLGGLWHGAAVSYAVWGFAHGALLALERAGADLLRKLGRDVPAGMWARYAYSTFVFTSVSCCWVLFRFQDFADVRSYFSGIVAAPLDFRGETGWFAFSLLYFSPVLLQHLLSTRLDPSRWHGVARGGFYGVLLWLALAERGLDTPFIYFRF